MHAPSNERRRSRSAGIYQDGRHLPGAGFNYFDTARGYLKGKSETAIRECLVKRYPRESFILTDKLTEPYFETEEDIRPFFESQLEACGVSYFDFYLMHAQNAENYKKFQKCHAYETAQRLKEEGKVAMVGDGINDAPALTRAMSESPSEQERISLLMRRILCL